MPSKKKAHSNSNIEQIFCLFQKHNSDPKTELNYSTPFQLLMAVLLSAQSQDKTVNKATEVLFSKVKHPADILEYDEQQLQECIKTIGLFRTKAKNILLTANILVTRYAGKLPMQRHHLEELPGIGAKSAAVLMNTLYKKPVIAVDTHVLRVSNRLGLIVESNHLKAEKKLLQVIPSWAKLNAHHWLVLHGRYICQARKPLCGQCIVERLCPYINKSVMTKKEKIETK